jgi:hypothetical protein
MGDYFPLRKGTGFMPCAREMEENGIVLLGWLLTLANSTAAEEQTLFSILVEYREWETKREIHTVVCEFRGWASEDMYIVPIK